MLRTVLTFTICASVQIPSAMAQSVRLPTEVDGDEIIVRALTIPRTALPTGVYWDSVGAVEQRIAREQKQMFFRCALKFTDELTLRRVADGESNSLRMKTALGFIVLNAGGCFPGLPTRTGSTTIPMTPAEYGSSPLDRGLVIEMILERYAPDASLTRADTQDPAIQERYRLREYSRNQLRYENDRNTWLLTTCLVREQPVLATRLVNARPGSPLERGLIQALLVDGRSCLGETKRLTVNPTIFRGYVVDAFYRWLVAARNVASLIPAA